MQIDIFVAADAEILEKEVDARGRYVLPGEIVVAKFLNDAGLKKKILEFQLSRMAGKAITGIT